MKIRVKSFEAWRFFMISTVFLAHCGFVMTNDRATEFFYHYMNNGVYGVTFFFLLSGFCLNLGYSEKLAALNKDTYKSFIWKRIKKVYPTYIVMQTLCLVAAIIKNPAADAVKELLWRYVISIPMLQMLIPNSKLYVSLNGVGWFMSALFLIYLITPVIIMLASSVREQKGKNAMILLALILLYIGMGLYSARYLEAGDAREFVMRSLPVDIVVFCIGVFLANLRMVFHREEPNRSGIRITGMTVLEIAAIVLAVWSYFETLRNPMWNTYLEKILVFMLLIFVYSYDGGILSKVFAWKPFLILGTVSFEFYLIHYFVVRYIAVWLQEKIGNTNRDNLLILILCFVVTWGVCVLIEMIKKRLQSRKRKAVSAA